MKLSSYMLLLKRLALAISIVSFGRFLFLVLNLNYFSNVELLQILLVFFYGLRFDFSTALILNTPFIIFSLIPIRQELYEKFIKYVFVVMNLLGFLINLIDSEYFQFNGKKLTKDIFTIASDMGNQLGQLSLYYWYIPFLFIMTSICIWYFYDKINGKNGNREIHLFLTPFVGFFILVLTFIGIRGGLQMRSISPKDAFIFEKYELGNLAINSAYTLIRSLNDEDIKQINFFKDNSSAIHELLKSRSFSAYNFNDSSNKNIMIIIVESLSQEYMDHGYTPFLSQLSREGLYFNHNYANGRRSIESLPSILVGMPSILNTPISQSQYQTNYFKSLPSILGEKGYDVSFFHGGKRGTMDFDAYTRSIGIDKYFGKEDYPMDKKHFDGTWGIFDHYFLSFMLDKIDDFKKPFFSTVFTLSSHQPYTIPSEFKDMFPQGNLEIHESIGYVDYSLKLFFEKAKEKSWYKDTLFVITADHTQKLSDPSFLNQLGKYRVPLIFYQPGKKLKSAKLITQQVDIVPSILDFLNIDQEKKLLFGSSVFNNDPGTMFNYISGRYMYLKDKFYVETNLQDYSVYLVGDDNLLTPQDLNKDSSRNLIREVKAMIQYGQNGLINNQLYQNSM